MMEPNVELSSQVESALAAAPAVRVPEDFAARVAAKAVAQPLPMAIKARRRVSMGRVVGLVAMVLMAIALFVVAPMAGTKVQSWPFALEMVLLVQLAAVGFGLVKADSR